MSHWDTHADLLAAQQADIERRAQYGMCVCDEPIIRTPDGWRHSHILDTHNAVPR